MRTDILVGDRLKTADRAKVMVPVGVGIRVDLEIESLLPELLVVVLSEVLSQIVLAFVFESLQVLRVETWRTEHLRQNLGEFVQMVLMDRGGEGHHFFSYRRVHGDGPRIESRQKVLIAPILRSGLAERESGQVRKALLSLGIVDSADLKLNSDIDERTFPRHGQHLLSTGYGR